MRKNRRTAVWILLVIIIVIIAVIVVLQVKSARSRQAMEEYRTQGIEQMDNGDYESAYESFTLAMENAGSSFGDLELDISYYRALAAYNCGDSDTAYQIYTDIMDYDTANFSPYYLRGCVLAAEGNTADACADFDTAVSMNTDDYELYINIYYSLSEAGAGKKANGDLKQALALSAEDADDLALQGYISWLLGKEDTAVTTLNEAVDAGSTEALLYLGVVQAASDDADSAKDSFDRYYESVSSDAEAVLLLAQKTLESGLADAAVTYYDAAVELNADTDDARTARRGQITACETAGDFETAAELIASYLEDYPDDEDAQKEQEFIQTRQ